MRQITHVAVTFDDKTYSMARPNRHHHVLHMMYNNGIRLYGPHKEGFLDSNGNFLTRQEAFELASTNGQLNRRKGKEFYQGTDLYSEDIW